MNDAVKPVGKHDDLVAGLLLARANMSRGTITCPRTARAVFCGGCFKAHGGLASVVQPCAMRRRLSVIIVIKRRQGRLHRGVGQNDGVPSPAHSPAHATGAPRRR